LGYEASGFTPNGFEVDQDRCVRHR
jgi:2-keto-4-pentenoate hydratase/2-oxohepta-3-ene-1,7-dioic acid hydratase in catechol pathway